MAIYRDPRNAKIKILASTSDFVPASRLESGGWQRALKEAVRDPAELCQLLELSPEQMGCATAATESFRLFVPRGYVARMRVGDSHDPLLRQVWPSADELAPVAGFTTDPVAEAAATLAPGLLQKYRGRALLVTTGACAVHCRYCFRRHFPYADSPRSVEAWGPAIEQIDADESIDEVILSGGDPLTLTDAWLVPLVGRLAEIKHLRRLRIHTRLPIMIPQRVGDSLLDWLTGTRLAPVVVVHANHPAEIDFEVSQALKRLVERGVTVLNQAVLLRGVNDSLEALAELSQRLFESRVLPYYLHQLDRVTGASHFEVSPPRGLELIEQLRARLPGYLVPRYVRELPGQLAKVPVESIGESS